MTPAAAPAIDLERRYQERLARYVAAMRLGAPDMVPIRPFVAEFTARHAGYTAQQATHDYELAFAAARRCATDFDWDAVVGNMIYVWTGLTQAIGLRYYAIPGIDIPATTSFQYREPEETHAFMRDDEYDALIADPTGFLWNVWYPRVSACAVAPGQPATYRSGTALVKGGMAMLDYFNAFGVQAGRLRRECGTPSAIAGIFKAPFDIIADKLRGYVGLTLDMASQPDKVLAACEALMPHLYHVAKTSADPQRQVPIGYWMHRGCVPFVSPKQYASHYWPTVKPIIEELWKDGHQTLFYAEGNWDRHLETFAELPEASIVYHVDRGDLAKAHQALGRKFCLSGGVANHLLSFGTPEQVRARVKEICTTVARDGHYIMDAGAIMQDDTRSENLRALTEATREYGVFSQGHAPVPIPPLREDRPQTGGMTGRPAPRIPAGICTTWDEVRTGQPPIPGDEVLARSVWDRQEGFANMFIWQVLLSF